MTDSACDEATSTWNLSYSLQSTILMPRYDHLFTLEYYLSVYFLFGICIDSGTGSHDETLPWCYSKSSCNMEIYTLLAELPSEQLHEPPSRHAPILTGYDLTRRILVEKHSSLSWWKVLRCEPSSSAHPTSVCQQLECEARTAARHDFRG